MDTALFVNKVWQPRLAKGSKLMKVWGKEGIMWPYIAAGVSNGAEAKVVMATNLSGRPFATWTAKEGVFGLRLATGALGKK